MNEKLDFQSYQLLIERCIPTEESFSVLNGRTLTEESDDSNSINEVTISVDQNCVWFVGKKGKGYPYSSEVYDRTTKKKERNPRTKNQVELRNQWFAMYHYSMGLLFIFGESKATFQAILRKYLDTDVLIKNVYKSKEEFLDQLLKIKSIRFVARKDLLTNPTSIFENTVNDLGLGNPEQIKMSVDYSYVDKTVAFTNTVKHLFSKIESGELTGLVIVGSHIEDDNTVESVFNIKSLGETIRIFCEKDEQGMFNVSQVKASLLEKFSSKDQ